MPLGKDNQRIAIENKIGWESEQTDFAAAQQLVPRTLNDKN